MPLPRDRPTTLADVALETPWLMIDCRRCGRAGKLKVSRLIRDYGGEAVVWTVVTHLSRDCPRKEEVRPYEICQVRCPTLSKFGG